MTISNGGEIFVRAPWNFVLSHRFRHICSMFQGTFKLLIEAVFTTALLRALPRSLAYVVFFTFILFSIFLFILMCFARSVEDPDLLEAMKSTKKVIESVGFIAVDWLCALVAVLGVVMFSKIEKLSPAVAFSSAFFVLLYLRVLIIIINRFSH